LGPTRARVRWAYKTICKNLSTKMIPKVRNKVETEIFEGNTKRNPHVIAPTVMVVCEDQDKGIT